MNMYSRVITVENYEEHKLFVASYLQTIAFLSGGLCNAKFIGRVVREVIFPMSEIERGELDIDTFKKVLDERKSILLSDIDILFDDSDDLYMKEESVFTVARKLNIQILSPPCEDELKDHPVSLFCLSIYEKSSSIFYNPIFETKFMVNCIAESEDYCICADFNIDNLSWSKDRGFGALFGSWKHHNFFRSRCHREFEEIFRIRDCIKNRVCEAMPSLQDLKADSLTKIEMIMAENYTVKGLDAVYKYHEGVDAEDRKCLICLDEIEENEKTLSLCGKNHLIHWHCGKKWWSGNNAFKCVVCKTNVLV